jgi:hypothetical protein
VTSTNYDLFSTCDEYPTLTKATFGIWYKQLFAALLTAWKGVNLEDVEDAIAGAARCAKLFASLTKMTKSMQTFGDAAWSGSAITAKDAAKRWPNRYHSGAGGVKNWSAVTVDDVVIKLGDSVKVLIQQADGTEDHEAFGVAIVGELWEDAGEKQFSARWCWRAQETILKTMATALCEDHIYAPDPRRVFIQKLPPVDDLDEVSNPHLIVIILSSTHSHLILTSSCHRRARIMNQAASMPTAAHSSSVKSPASTNMTSARRPPRSRTFTTI